MFTLMFLGRALTAMASLASAVGLAVVTVCAQTAVKPRPEFMKVMPPPSPAESIEAPVAAKLADRLGQAWFDSAAPDCRVSRSLDIASYRNLARTMLVAVGEHMTQRTEHAQDGPKADEEFAARAGAGAAEELRRLSGEPVVREFLVRLRNRNAVEQTQYYLENIDRALLLRRFQASAQGSPLAAGDTTTLEAIEKVSSAPLDYVDASKDKAMNRFLELMTVAEGAMADTTNRDELIQWGPGRLMVILEEPLKAHCVTRR
jgi:hypothetical protein